MVGLPLMRGMLVGLVAALLSFGFLKLAGEPPTERAIAFETRMDAAKAKAGGSAEGAATTAMSIPEEGGGEPPVSRPTQAGIGLLTGVTVYNVAFGGLFAVAFALAFGRMGAFGPRTTSALLALSGFIALTIVPALKYPANPPSVGEADTIGTRTALYFAMIAISLAAMVGAWMVRGRLIARVGAWDASLIAGALYLAVVAAAALALPVVNEVPNEFPAVVLWQFRLASIGAQLITWTTIGLLFGALSERASPGRGSSWIRSARF